MVSVLLQVIMPIALSFRKNYNVVLNISNQEYKIVCIPPNKYGGGRNIQAYILFILLYLTFWFIRHSVIFDTNDISQVNQVSSLVNFAHMKYEAANLLRVFCDTSKIHRTFILSQNEKNVIYPNISKYPVDITWLIKCFI